MADAKSVVLLVEDNAEISENMVEILGCEGHLCWPALTADAALERLAAEARPPDLILLDLRMPGMRTVDFVSVVRKRPEWTGIPIMLITAAGAEDIPANLDVDEVMHKPFRLDDLLRLVDELLARGRHQAVRP